jgi:recombination protein RecA
VVKNKMAPPFKECLCDIIYGLGISRAGEIVELGVTYGVIRKAGAWYYFPPDNEGAQGKEAARAWIQEHTVVANELERQIRERMAASPALVTPSASAPPPTPESLIGPGSLADLVPRKAET